MRFKRHVKIQTSTLDMTPLIDVVFQLLLFFMLSSSFILQPGIRIRLPQALTSKVTYDKMDIITLTRNHRIFFNELEVSAQQLNYYLQEIAKKDGLILIKADAQVDLGSVVHVWDLCRQAGITQLNIATEPSKL